MLTVKSVIQRPLATVYINQDSYIFATLYLRYIRFISGWSGAEIKHTVFPHIVSAETILF